MAHRHKKAHTPASANNTTCKRGYHYLTLDNTPIPEFLDPPPPRPKKSCQEPAQHTHTHTQSLSLSLHTLPVPRTPLFRTLDLSHGDKRLRYAGPGIQDPNIIKFYLYILRHPKV